MVQPATLLLRGYSGRCVQAAACVSRELDWAAETHIFAWAVHNSQWLATSDVELPPTAQEARARVAFFLESIARAVECLQSVDGYDTGGLLCSRTALLLVQVLGALLPTHQVPLTARQALRRVCRRTAALLCCCPQCALLRARVRVELRHHVMVRLHGWHALPQCCAVACAAATLCCGMSCRNAVLWHVLPECCAVACLAAMLCCGMSCCGRVVTVPEQVPMRTAATRRLVGDSPLTSPCHHCHQRCNCWLQAKAPGASTSSAASSSSSPSASSSKKSAKKAAKSAKMQARQQPDATQVARAAVAVLGLQAATLSWAHMVLQCAVQHTAVRSALLVGWQLLDLLQV
jgi:hypothetical protein